MSQEILVIDIESTCWPKDQIPQGMHSEIIEIGHCVYNYKDNSLGNFGSIIVKPQHSKVGSFCTNLTGWTQEVLIEKGILFNEACDILTRDFNSLGRPWASYGNYDKSMFEKMCQIYGVNYPFTPQHLNVKAMTTVLLGKRMGLGQAIDKLGIQFIGKQHNGGDDAHNIARILHLFTTKLRTYK